MIKEFLPTLKGGHNPLMGEDIISKSLGNPRDNPGIPSKSERVAEEIL